MLNSYSHIHGAFDDYRNQISKYLLGLCLKPLLRATYFHYTMVANENANLIMNVCDTIDSCFVWLRLNNKCTVQHNTNEF